MVVNYRKEYTTDPTDNINKPNIGTNLRLVTFRGSMEK